MPAMLNTKSVSIGILLVLMVSACAFNDRFSPDITSRIAVAANHNGSKFVNDEPTQTPTIGNFLRIFALMATKDRSRSVPGQALPVSYINAETLQALSNDELHIVKLGHSSVLLKVFGEYWLIDPVFADRVSPVSFAGPRRFHPVPIPVDELPPIDRVLISHNHYDHLDKYTIEVLAPKSRQFLVPLGVEVYLEEWGVPAEAISSFQWWQEQITGNTMVAFTPSKHFSSRSFNDRDKTLWGSWVVAIGNRRLFFSGDTGYFDGLKTIGEQYGPFDMTFIETGAYAKEWPDVHLFPEQSVQAHLDLKGITMIPIHNGTFDLSFHPWEEPLERVTQEAQKRNVEITTPIVGEIFTVDEPPAFNAWWRSVLADS